MVISLIRIRVDGHGCRKQHCGKSFVMNFFFFSLVFGVLPPTTGHLPWTCLFLAEVDAAKKGTRIINKEEAEKECVLFFAVCNKKTTTT